VQLNIGGKIFAIAISLLLLMSGLLFGGLRLFDQVTDQLQNVVSDYLPIYDAIAGADNDSLEQGLGIRRAVIRRLDGDISNDDVSALRTRLERDGRSATARLDEARNLLARRLANPSTFEDNAAVVRLDTRVENVIELQAEIDAHWPLVLNALIEGDRPTFERQLFELDRLRDKIIGKVEQLKREISAITQSATQEVLRRQRSVMAVSAATMAVALVIGILFSGLVTRGLVRPVHRLLSGTRAVQQGQLDTLVQATTRDEIGHLTDAFNLMVADLRVKERIKETFGRYVDPRIVAGLIDRPDLAKTEGERRVMTILFCDMKGFTGLSEGLTPPALVRLINAYLTDLSVPIRERTGIIDKYIGDAVMAYWGPPFSQHQEQAKLACLAALDQLDRIAVFRKAAPEIVGLKRGLPDIDIRIGIATGEVVVGNIGSDVSMNYTVMGDTVNLASRLEGAGKVYGTRTLISEETWRMAADAIEVRELDQLMVLGKTEPQRIFELLGRKGQVEPARLELAEAFARALGHYRERRFADAEQAFAQLVCDHPYDKPSEVYLQRSRDLHIDPPPADWDGVWRMAQK
jgi:class 3 adenylate cyclase